VRYLQLDHLPAYTGIDRVNPQQPAREPGGPLIGLACHRRLGCLLQHRRVVGEALHGLLSQAVPVLGPIVSAIEPDQLKQGGDVVRVGLATALQVIDDWVAEEVVGIPLDLRVLACEVGEMAEDHAPH
jgi:hypothetical protein